MKRFQVRVSRLKMGWEETEYLITAQTLEEARRIAVDEEKFSTKKDEKGIENFNSSFIQSTIEQLSNEEHYWLIEKSNGCDTNIDVTDFKYNTTILDSIKEI